MITSRLSRFAPIPIGIILAAALAPIPGESQTPRQIDLPAPASAAAATFHPPSSAAEQALDAIIHMDDGDDDGRLFFFAIKAPWRDRSLDRAYSPYFSRALQESWRRTERAMVTRSCGGHYKEGELCGMESGPITCAQDISGIGYLYRTRRSGPKERLIEMTWISLPGVVATYRMVIRQNRWILDGVNCTQGFSFNWTRR